MSLTRRLLKELELNEYAVERIIAAHAETVDALRREHEDALAAASTKAEDQREALRTQADAHRQEAARLQDEYDRYRRQVDQERNAAQRQTALADALRRAGANEQAIPLLLGSMKTTEGDWEGAQLRDEAAVLAPVLTQHAAFFAQPVPVPTNRITPPLDGAALTMEDVRRMSAAEINRNWNHVCSALTLRSE